MRVVKTNALICAFVVAYATCWVSHDATHMYLHLAVSYNTNHF